MAKRLHASNGMIILGEKLVDPVTCVVCWTKNGKAAGGTGQGIRIASAYRIPVFNLKIEGRFEALLNFCELCEQLN